jgi:transcriptional regulator with XRE-family HTH domain
MACCKVSVIMFTGYFGRWKMGEIRILSKGEIGAAIRQRRKELALSQEGLAIRLNVSYQQVQRYESGKIGMTVENLQLIAQALAVPIGYFFTTGAGAVAGRDDGDVEGELLAHYRKIRQSKVKEMVVNFARLVAGWDVEECTFPEDVAGERKLRGFSRPLGAQDAGGGTEENDRYSHRCLA